MKFDDVMEMLKPVESNKDISDLRNVTQEDVYNDQVRLRLKETYNSDAFFEPKAGEYAPKGSLWNNPAVNKMNEKLTPEQREYFEKQGEKMYNFDFVNVDIDSELKEMTEYVIFGLKSGLSPSDMSDEEKDAMCEIYGPTWYLQYGFTEEDIYGDED